MGLLRLPKLGWTVISTIATTAGLLPLGIQVNLAQPSSAVPGPCQPPGMGEYLVFVLSRTPEAQATVRGKVPSDTTTIVCDYQGAPVTRLGGFGSEDAANAWARYLIQSTGLQSVVVRPSPPVPSALPPVPPASMAVNPPTANAPGGNPANPPATTPATPSKASGATSAPTGNAPTIVKTPGKAGGATTGTYQPQPLGSGHAVLISYGNRPELANQLRQVLNKEVGLAVYGQRPYLLALQTSDLTAANSVLQLLSDRGFLGLVVEAKRVVLLKGSVMVNP